jgi:hypothetical protein
MIKLVNDLSSLFLLICSNEWFIVHINSYITMFIQILNISFIFQTHPRNILAKNVYE